MYEYPDYLMHYGVLGMKLGVRRYQNKDGAYTQKGRRRYFNGSNKVRTSHKDRLIAKYKEKKGIAIKQRNQLLKSGFVMNE